MEPRELARLRAERDLYRRLLSLGAQERLEPFLEEALALIVEIGEARQGYLELHDDEAPASTSWWRAHGIAAEELQDIRTAVSSGIIAEAIATGQTILTPSALLDPRFKERESVRLGQIEAVLCAPIGEDPPIGVLYLQGRADRGVFSEEDRSLAETFCRHLAPLAERLLAPLRRRGEGDDALRALRATLRLDGVIGHSGALVSVLRHIARIAPVDINVLLTGESGTGKSLFARVIHDNGPRARGPFVELNCATLPETLVESELFGAQKGAHSTASERTDGKVAAAEGGTLFLDEIATLPLSSQAKLLQLVQNKEYYSLGSARPQRADVRIIAATNADLEAEVAAGRFRQDLFYRLSTLPVRVPSLAERREDIAPIAEHFVAAFCDAQGRPRLPLSRNARRALEAADWPGNVRQLWNAVQSAVLFALSDGAAEVDRLHFFPEAEPPRPNQQESLGYQQATRLFQRDLLKRMLEECDWNVTESANRLDLARAHVYNLIRAFGLERR